MDDFGRVKETISIGQSPQKYDQISHTEYDNFGRIAKQYLPYTSNNQRDGYFIDEDIAEVETTSFYKHKFGDEFAFSEKVFETSPANKVIESSSPGSPWKLGSPHTVINDYLINNENDEVYKYEVQFINDYVEDPKLVNDCNDKFYAENQLFRYITKDEDRSRGYDHTVEEFKNSNGQIILKRTYNSASRTPRHDTYYVYDDFGNLTYIIPPKASEIIEGRKGDKQAIAYTEYINWVHIAEVDKELADEYETALKSLEDEQLKEGVLLDKYGGEGGVTISVNTDNDVSLNFDMVMASPMPLKTGLIAMIESEEEIADQNIDVLEGTDYSYRVYIQNGGIYISGEGSVQQLQVAIGTTPSVQNCNPSQTILDNLCFQYKYDHRKRLVEKKLPGKGWEYIVYDRMDRPILALDANQKDDTNAINSKWLFTKYDRSGRVVYTGIYTGDSRNRKAIQSFIDTNTTLPLFETKIPYSSGTYTNIDNINVSYTNDAFPYNNLSLLSINYYDDYDFYETVSYSIPNNVLNQNVTSRTNGLVTCGKTRVLDTNYWITTVSAYDDKAREIYSYSNNPYLESTDILYTELGYVGNILKTIHEHDKDNEDVITIEDNYSYDHTGRLLKQTQTISQAGGINEVVITENEYDELGQLVKKGLGGQNSQNRLQYLDYKYNIRGWLTNINDVFRFNSDLFAENIRYEKPDDPNVTKKYNGNISEIIWMTANDYKGRTYTYEYDALDRISEANYYMAFEQSLEDYSLSNISYDKNGNIYSLERMGYYPDSDTYDFIDVLTYEYEDTSNKLSSVSDTAGVLGFDDQNTTGDDYDYDENGNMVIDNNKSIQNITYNHLNLPTLIDFGSSNKIEYFYNAAGIKLKKVVTDNGNITTTKYNGGFVYVDDELQYMKQSEGYIEPNYAGGFKHIFQLEDHLGNVRITFQHNASESTSIEEIFEFNTGSWTPTNNDNVTINNNNGELNLSIKDKWNGINKYIDIIPNTPIHIEFDFNKGTMESTTFFVQERINGNWEAQGEYDVFPNLPHGRFKTDLVLSGDAIRLKFEKANNSDNGVFTTCYIDNFIFYQNAIDIVEENNYYPFGLKHMGYNWVVNSTNPALKYKYQGQERQDELDLNWDSFKWRNYDYAIGRFFNVDPLSEKFPLYSPYAFSGNKVISYKELEGLEEVIAIYGNGQQPVIYRMSDFHLNDWNSLKSTYAKYIENTTGFSSAAWGSGYNSYFRYSHNNKVITPGNGVLSIDMTNGDPMFSYTKIGNGLSPKAYTTKETLNTFGSHAKETIPDAGELNAQWSIKIPFQNSRLSLGLSVVHADDGFGFFGNAGMSNSFVDLENSSFIKFEGLNINALYNNKWGSELNKKSLRGWEATLAGDIPTEFGFNFGLNGIIGNGYSGGGLNFNYLGSPSASISETYSWDLGSIIYDYYSSTNY